MPDMVKKPVAIKQDEDNPVAFDTSKISDPQLKAEVDAVKVNLGKLDLQGIRARVIVLLDFSISMDADYSNGNVQDLIRRALAFSMNVDTDGVIEVIKFGSRAEPVFNVDSTNYAHAADLLSQGQMGSTNLTAGLRVVRDIAAATDEVIYLFVITDGNPDNEGTAAAEYAALADYAVFIKHFAIRPVDFLVQIDTFNVATAPRHLQVLASRRVDNCNTQFVANPSSLTPEQFAALAAEEWYDWFIAAQHAGILV